MSSKRYPEEFKIEAVKQVTERGHSALDVVKRLGIGIMSAGYREARFSSPGKPRD